MEVVYLNSKLLCPSMMCADFRSLEEEVNAFEKTDIDIYHIDIMDGSFVPNFGMGLQDFEYIRKSTKRKVDVHLMTENPSNHINLFAEKGADIIHFHPETDFHPARTIDRIHSKGMEAGIALNPGTSVATVETLLSFVDYVLVMTVNPGFAGQKYLGYVNEKIEILCKVREQKKYNFKVIVDGAISLQKIADLSKIGVDGFVLGTSSLFGKDKPYEEIINRLRSLSI